MLNDLQLLQLEGGDLDFKSSVIAGATPLHIAAANGYLSVVEFLLEHHVSTDVEDDDLWQVRTTEMACSKMVSNSSKKMGLKYVIKWSIIKFARSYRKVMRFCDLCLTEKVIIALADSSSLNKRSEINSKCRHMNEYKLSNVLLNPP